MFLDVTNRLNVCHHELHSTTAVMVIICSDIGDVPVPHLRCQTTGHFHKNKLQEYPIPVANAVKQTLFQHRQRPVEPTAKNHGVLIVHMLDTTFRDKFRQNGAGRHWGSTRTTSVWAAAMALLRKAFRGCMGG